MATIHVDGKSYEVNGSENLLQACLSLGIDIPYFCWHPSLGSVGSCRMHHKFLCLDLSTYPQISRYTIQGHAT
jgi:predicted molibdopterin-dependent oxidoreductase YjgC